MSTVYILINKINGKMYVGCTTQKIENRIKSHVRDATYGKPLMISKAIRKYGIDNFDITHYEVEDKCIDEIERLLILLFDTLYPIGYNVETGGRKGFRIAERTKQKISAANKGKLCGEKNYMFGKTHSEETKKKISKINKGKHYSIKTEFKKGNIPWHSGKKLPELSGGNHSRAISIKLIHSDGREEIFNSAVEACRKYNLNPSHLHSVYKGKLKTHKGFKAVLL